MCTPLGNTWLPTRRQAAWQSVSTGVWGTLSLGEDKTQPLHNLLSTSRLHHHPSLSSPHEFPAPPSLRKAPSAQPSPGVERQEGQPLAQGKDPARAPHPMLPDSLLNAGEPWPQGCGACRPHPEALRWPTASPRQTCCAPRPQARPWSLPLTPSLSSWVAGARTGLSRSPSARTCPTALAPALAPGSPWPCSL